MLLQRLSEAQQITRSGVTASCRCTAIWKVRIIRLPRLAVCLRVSDGSPGHCDIFRFRTSEDHTGGRVNVIFHVLVIGLSADAVDDGTQDDEKAIITVLEACAWLEV